MRRGGTRGTIPRNHDPESMGNRRVRAQGPSNHPILNYHDKQYYRFSISINLPNYRNRKVLIWSYVRVLYIYNIDTCTIFQLCIKGPLYSCTLRIKYFTLDKFLSWIFFESMNFGDWCSLKKKMLSRFLTKFEKYDLWSAEIFFLKFVTFKIAIFFFYTILILLLQNSNNLMQNMMSEKYR